MQGLTRGWPLSRLAELMRVLVYGGRNFDDRRWLFRVLDELDARSMISCIIEGEAAGTDTQARFIQECITDLCTA
ncbi:MAG TPA: SLOG family protein [Bradyrhizobium sp.]|nr:SLOG family protein [Bradyrhizobium sp.]